MAINYYDLIVAVAREADNPRFNKESCKQRLLECFEKVGIKFEQEKFDVAFSEFHRANERLFRPIMMR